MEVEIAGNQWKEWYTIDAMSGVGEIFGRNLRQLRKTRGWTQDDLAQKLGLHYMTVQRWESGDRWPDSEVIDRLANIFGVRPADLVRESDEDPMPIMTQEQILETFVKLFGRAMGVNFEVKVKRKE